MALKRVYVIHEYKNNDWEQWDWPKPYWDSKKDAENFLFDYWRDLDLGQEDYKMDNYLIEEEFIKC